MNNHCKYLKIKFNNKLYCKKLKKEITISECSKNNFINNCKDIDIKKAAVKKKTIKKKISKSKRRITVSKETYNATIERDNYHCRLSHNSECSGRLELHHILYRSQRKDLINNIDNCIMLCTKHHKTVHNNKKKWQPILIEMNKR